MGLVLGKRNGSRLGPRWKLRSLWDLILGARDVRAMLINTLLVERQWELGGQRGAGMMIERHTRTIPTLTGASTGGIFRCPIERVPRKSEYCHL